MYAKRGSLLMEALLLLMITMIVASLCLGIASYSYQLQTLDNSKQDEDLKEIYEQ